MTFGQQPQGNSANGFNGQPYGQNQYNQNPYVQNQYQYAPQGAYAQSVPTRSPCQPRQPIRMSAPNGSPSPAPMER